VLKLVDSARNVCGLHPDRDSSPAVRRYLVRTPRYIVVEARA